MVIVSVKTPKTGLKALIISIIMFILMKVTLVFKVVHSKVI